MSTAVFPKKIGPYRVLRPLGRGGMAQVYVAQDVMTGEEHALKIMEHGSRHADRFNQEYEALTRLNHPGIVRVYQYGIHNDAPWFSMELIAGEPLQIWMKRVGRPGMPARTEEVMRAGSFLADAVSYVHERGLIHRDLKGNNVLMLPDGRVKLLDFGTAHIRDAIRKLTGPGEFIGTLAYASPEQFTGKPIDFRVDLYALGVLLYRMVTGHRPFTADDTATLARMIAKYPPTPPSDLISDLPDGLEELILSLLEKKPELRPKSAHVVAQRLEELTGKPLSLPGWAARARTDRLAGREDVLRQLRLVLDEQGARMVLLLGGHGSDRIKIADALLGEARKSGEMTLIASMLEQGDVSCIIDMLLVGVDDVPHMPDPRVLAAVRALRLLQQRSRAVVLKNREGMEAACQSVLVGLARVRGPTLLVVHNVHLADSVSLEILVRLRSAVARGGLPVRFLLTALQGSDGDAALHRFSDVKRVALGPLSIPQVALKVGAMLDRRPPPVSLARSIHMVSGGQPSWVESVVLDLADRGAIQLIGENGDRVSFEIDDDLTIPANAEDLLIGNLWRLPSIHRRVLEAICIAGDPVPLDLLAKAVNWRTSQLLVVLKLLSRRHWIRVEDSEVRLVEPLIGQLLPQVMREPRLRVYQSLLADALHDAPPRPAHVDILLHMGRPGEAVQRALDCANHFLDDLATVDALDVLERVTGLAHTPSDVPRPLLAEAMLLYANCLLMLRPVDPQLGRALASATRFADEPEIRARIELARARLHRTLGHLSNFHRHLEEAWSIAATGPSDRTRSIIATFLGHVHRLQARLGDAEIWFETALSCAETAGPREVAWAQAATASLRVSEGNFSAAEPLLASAMATFEEHNDRRGLWTALPTWATVLQYQGRYSQILRKLYEELAKARSCQEPTHTVRLLLTAASIEVDLYRLGRAQEHIDEIDMLVRKGEQLEVRLASQVIRGRILSASGHLVPACVALNEAYDRARSADIPATAELARALLAEALWELGEYKDAKEMFASALAALMTAGDKVALIEAVLARARAQSGVESPSRIFKPIQKVTHEHHLPIVRVARLLEEARHYKQQGNVTRARRMARDASTLLEVLSERMEDTDRAALRVHPWSRRIHQIMK